VSEVTPPAKVAPQEPAQPEPAAPTEEDFGSMLDQSMDAKSVKKGETIQGTLVSITQDAAFIDVGGKGEAIMSPDELLDESGELHAKVGDRIQAVVVSTAGGIHLSHKLARAAASREQLKDAFRAGLPVEGKVLKSIKGGFEVRVAGQRGFCPMSQIDLVRGTQASQHEGKVYAFRILECKDSGKNVVLSRRSLLEEEQREKAEEVMQRLEPGVQLPGRVVSVRDYGAFVDIGSGVQGLLHVSEMGWSRVPNAASVVKVGQEISVQILKVDPKTRKISLSLKHLQEDPWLSVGESYAIGNVVEGRVSRVTDFGAFVELEPGVEALAHMSTFVSSKEGWKTTVQVGASKEFRIQSVDPERRRIGVAPADAPVQERPAAPRGAGPRTRDSKPPRGQRKEKRGGAPLKHEDAPPAGGFGSLADKLRAALNGGKKDD
jgi:small subunit ribosomal protein S1